MAAQVLGLQVDDHVRAMFDGAQRVGVGTVLSPQSGGTPFSCAIVAMGSMSSTSLRGLGTDSP